MSLRDRYAAWRWSRLTPARIMFDMSGRGFTRIEYDEGLDASLFIDDSARIVRLAWRPGLVWGTVRDPGLEPRHFVAATRSEWRGFLSSL